MSALETYLRQMAPDGLRLHIWPTAAGQFQASVAERGIGTSWTCVIDDDPAHALQEALRQRSGGVAIRNVEREPDQIDIEEAIAGASTTDPMSLLG